jgi:tetratricopeptide (TPR) repeat protein/tRNA A-37 threonylcarbamoyl transferase component Bud32
MSEVFYRLTDALAERYAIERELGAGGMATVYLAEDLKHHRKVAVKVLRPELAAALGQDRFFQEIEIAASLHHPHILPLYDSGEADGFLYYVMPYEEGQSLREKLAREGELPIAEAVRILRDVVDALTHAHKHNVVHRDIKPDNVMLSGRHALVTDFGVAKAVSEATGRQKLTTEGIALGTPTYMSPEQAAADPHIDHRADIYAVGVVAYELLTGRPPFLGTTPQMILAAHMTDTPEPVHKYRESVPPALEQLVMKCLEKRPADRWQSADELLPQLEALATPSGGTVPTKVEIVGPTTRRKWRFAAAGVVLAILIAVVGLMRFSRPDPTLDPNLLAVAPFDVLSADEELGIWGEGIMDLLSRSLDGAGPLRTLSASMSVRNWEGRADPVSAKAFGRRTGAGLAVFGTLVAIGSDSARVSATLLDVASGVTLAEIETRDRADRVDRLADSLSVHLFGELTRQLGIGGARFHSVGSTSPAAIKAFLKGERLYRSSSWDSARVYYEQAVDLDSTFTLAHLRTALVLGWAEEGFGVGSQGLREYQIRAGNMNHGLAPRESLLVHAESLYAGITPDFDGDWSLLERLISTMEGAARRYPEDPEVWTQLGEVLYHFGRAARLNPERAQAAFYRAIELDSAFAPAYIHAAELAFTLDGPKAGQQILSALLDLHPVGDQRSAAQLTLALLDPERAQSEEVRVMLDTVSENALEHAMVPLQRLPDSAESALRVARAMAERSAAGRGDLRRLLAHRGHLDAAYNDFTATDWRLPTVRNWLSQDLFAELALLGAIPEDTVRVIFDSWIEQGYGEGSYLTNRWRADRRDTVGLERIVSMNEMALESLRLEADVDTAIVKWSAACSRAYLSLARGDTTTALERFAGLRIWPSVPLAYKQRLAYAQMLVAVGRDVEAAAVLDEITEVWHAPGPVEVIWVLERARVNERLGNYEKAIRDYSHLMDVWRNADAVLLPMVDEAREAVARLTSEEGVSRR